MEVPFKLVVELATPFVIGPLRTTLDGLLSAAIFREQGLMGEDTIPHIPLTSEHGIFKGSSLFCHPNYSREVVGRVMALRSSTDLDPDLFKPQGRSGRYTKIDMARGDYKINMSSYQGIRSREVYWWGVGDPERTVELIQHHIQGIGKRSNAGAGQVESVRWEDSEDHSWITVKSRPARPLPVALWSAISGGRPAAVGKVAVRLPYWNGELADAVFPESLVV
ncbi:hypothetical protein [Azotobacter chroococcum]|uniref:hypothetical protein n=1 Tax=Azotobacter chroococcum TaxID=353 RepID=UPI0010ADD54D|nr:hypothetical protein [Azotobacter chroococcum]TKD35293.1 hypothetical protein FCG41_17795 [Azotobacter chroococcum]